MTSALNPRSVPPTVPRYLVRHGLEEDGRGRDLLLLRHEAVREVAAVRQVQSHDPPVGLHQGSVDGKVGRGALSPSRVGKHKHTNHVID